MNSRFCAHCSSHLSVKTWKTHRRLYFDNDTETWIKKACTEEEFDDWDEELHLSTAFEDISEGSPGNSIPSIVSDTMTFSTAFEDISQGSPGDSIPSIVDFSDDDIFYDAVSNTITPSASIFW